MSILFNNNKNIILVYACSDTSIYDKMTHKGVSKWVKQGVPARE